MKKAIKPVHAAVAVGVAFAFGVSSMWVLSQRSEPQGILGLALAHELETTGLCANSLRLNNASDRERLTRLLEDRLDDAVARATELTDQGAELSGAAPNLRDSIRRAADHYADTGKADEQRRAETLLARLSGNHE